MTDATPTDHHDAEIYDPQGLEAALLRAARHGAREALREIGLGDENAGRDITELRAWLDNMRLMKSGFMRTTVKVFTLAFWVTMLGGLIAYAKDHIK